MLLIIPKKKEKAEITLSVSNEYEKRKNNEDNIKNFLYYIIFYIKLYIFLCYY